MKDDTRSDQSSEVAYINNRVHAETTSCTLAIKPTLRQRVFITSNSWDVGLP